MKKYLIIIPIVFLLWNVRPVEAQTDTEFWFAVPKVTQGHGWGARRFFFRFANLDDANRITISMPANPAFIPIVRDLDPFQAETVDVTAIILQIWTENPNQIYNRGIKITATNLTTAYFEVGTHNNPDIFSLKGRNALGTDFFVPFQDHFNNGVYNPRPYSGIYIVATQDQTKITVTPSRNAFPGRPAGVPFDIILNMGETFAVAPHDFQGVGMQAANHLGGTRVQSDKPIAISTSDDSVAANPYGGCRDLIGDQLIPTSIIGKEYIAMRGQLGKGGSATMPEFFYVVATKPNTQLLIDGDLKALLQPGQQYRWRFTQQTHHIKTNEPSYVYHVAGFGCEMGGAVLPPIDVCTGSTRVSFTRSKGESFFLNILVRAGAQDGFKFNGGDPNTRIKATDFTAIPGNNEWLAAEFTMNQTDVPIGVASLIENIKDVFHLGIINGGASSGTMYGYFSDFNQLNVRANISQHGAMYRTCFGEPVQLIARGGTSFLWSPPDYLDDPTIARPVALVDKSMKYTVTVSGACGMTDSTSVNITLYGPAEAKFTIDESVGCSPFDLTVVNESFGITNYSWRMGDGTIYNTAAEEFNHVYTNTTDAPIVRDLMLVGRYSHCRDTLRTQITVLPELTAVPTVNKTQGCAPLEVNFGNQSTGLNNTYLWEFGDGSSSTQAEPTYVFQNFTSQDTAFTVKLTAIAPSGCISEDSLVVVVKPYIEAGFDFDPPVHCSPYPVTLSNTSFGATTNMWSFDNGTSFENIPGKQFIRELVNNSNTPDTLTLWLIAQNQSGCRDTLTRQLVVNPAVKASFTADNMEGCNPLPVQFTNTSVGPNNTYLWNFDHHEGTSSEHSPKVWFDNPGTTESMVFNVRLTATSEHFCTDVVEKQITVSPRVVAGFTFDYASFCTPQEIVFHNTSEGATTYQWNFADGNTSNSPLASVSNTFYNHTGTELIMPVELLIANANGCTDKIVREVTIYPQVVADFDFKTSGCHPLEVIFNNASSGAEKYLWSFGDGGNSQEVDAPQRIYTNPDHLVSKTYEVSLLAESKFGCSDVIKRNITVYPKPKASFSLSETFGCAPLGIGFEPNTIGASQLKWNFGDGSIPVVNYDKVDHTYNNNTDTAITFTSQLIAINDYSCMDTIVMNTQVYPAIEARIEVTEISGCHPLELMITNVSKGASAATPYVWSYGDGKESTSTLAEQVYTYTNFSHTERVHYDLKLHAESHYGCKDQVQTTITVFPKPVAVFEPLITEGCSPLTVNFADASKGANKYNWVFDESNGSTKKGDVTYEFIQPHNMGEGKFPVGLKVENSFGCVDSTKRQITVFPDITADFEVITEGCHPLSVDFKNLSLGANTMYWNFGEGSTSGHENPSYVYTNESHTTRKHYNVQLNTSSVYGCKAQSNQVITVFPKPTSDFDISIAEGCAPLTIDITNLSLGGSAFEWNLGGKQSNSSDKNFTNIFHNKTETPQTLNLYLKSANDDGCYREVSKNILVYPEVVANYATDNVQMTGCNPLTLEFANQSERGHKYTWDFGDGNFSGINKPVKTFFTPGTQESTYDITLKAESVYGCKDSIVKQAKVLPVPMADLFVSPHIQSFPSKSISVENHSAPGNWDFTWHMGDGRVFTTHDWESIDYEYGWPTGDYASRQFTVSLNVSNGYCSDSISQQVIINAPHPVVGFDPSAQGCPPLEIQFINDTKYGLEFHWDFNDGNYSQEENPKHVFTEPGEYLVKLLVSGEGGVDSAYQTITVFELPRADFRVTPNMVQLPYESINMVNLSSLAAYYEWHMGDGTIYHDYEPEHKYDKPGNYDITLHVATNTLPQCFDTIVKAGAVLAEQDCELIFPDAFTPDTSGPSGGQYVINDPANHVFYPIHTGIKEYEMEIYSRWGEFLFRTTDLNTGWDGYYRDRLANMDVYVWKAWATCYSGKEIKKAGDVTLYR
jgi:PKD repeat protein